MLWRLRKWVPKDLQLCFKCGKYLAKNTATYEEVDWMRIWTHQQFYCWHKINTRANPVTCTVATYICPKHRFSRGGLALLPESKEMIIPLSGANGSRII
jgi:hypothetical protein